MTIEERTSWITTIEYLAGIIADELGWDVVNSALEYCGVDSLEDLSESQYAELYNELSAIEADMK